MGSLSRRVSVEMEEGREDDEEEGGGLIEG
jgi:hypothetical protein